MRVLHVTPSLERAFGGPTRSLAGFVRAGRGAGAAITVAGPRCAPEDLEAFDVEAGPHERIVFRRVGRAAAVSSPSMWQWIRREARRFDCVHVHGLFNPISSMAARLSVGAGVPCVVRPFGTLSRFTFEYRRRRLKEIYFRCIDGPNLRAVAGIHFTTEAERAEARWRGIDFGEREWVVPPPWTGRTARFDRDARPTVVFISRLHPKKGIETLLRAWQRVVKEVPAARLVLASSGEPSYVTSLRRLARELDITGSAEFIGFAAGDAKQQLLESAWLFVLPSYHENFGVAVLDALGAGLPVAITPEVQLAPFVAEQRLGVVAPREPAAFAAALTAALRDRALRDRCATVAPALIADLFGDARIGPQLISMYAAACGRPIRQRSSRMVDVHTGH